ncbi:MAG: class I SAM-dependent methyltransferase [Syntrophorhabdaceae bacterium]|nr:class I SAM-dependent methyltransferase [Syntrophorhabdaceae bacterium]
METPDWDKRYREGFYDGAKGPHGLLKRFAPAAPPGIAVDIAMGNGRDAVFLAERGFAAYGLERSMEAIKQARQKASESGARIFAVYGDANNLPFRSESAGLVVVFYFLLRNIMEEITRILRKDGILVYETFLKRQNLIDRRRTDEYLLNDGELIGCFPGMEPLFYEETITGFKGKKKIVARYAGRKR